MLRGATHSLEENGIEGKVRRMQGQVYATKEERCDGSSAMEPSESTYEMTIPLRANTGMGDGNSGPMIEVLSSPSSRIPLSVVLIGKTGDGKSTLGNMLISGTTDVPFEAGNRLSRITRNTYRMISNDEEWEVFDTVGLDSNDNHARNAEVARNLYKELVSQKWPIDVFCYVKRATLFTNADESCWLEFVRLFGEYSDNIVLVFTSCRQGENWIEENKETIDMRMGRNFSRRVGVDFPPDDEDEPAEVRHQREARRAASLQKLKERLRWEDGMRIPVTLKSVEITKTRGCVRSVVILTLAAGGLLALIAFLSRK